MKKINTTLFLMFLTFVSIGQINTISTNNRSITISPKGIIDDRPFNISQSPRFIAIGDSALLSLNSTNLSNIAIGPKAMAKANNIIYNIAIGEKSMYNSTAGNTNIGIGFQTLSQNIANDNIAIGFNTLKQSVSGNSNLAIGSNSLGSNKKGTLNIALGSSALLNADLVSNNIAIGNGSLNDFNNTDPLGTGNVASTLNIAIGTLSSSKLINDNIPSRSNITIGYAAMYKAIYGSDNVTLGSLTLGNITNSVANTAVGEASMLGLVNNGAVLSQRNSGLGHYALIELVNGSNNTGLGAASGNSLKLGNNNSFLGVSSGIDATLPVGTIINNSMALGFNAKVNASDKVVIGNASVANIGGYATWTNYSDKRLKENIVYTNKLGLNFINQLNTASYNYKADENKRRRDGLIAQDVQQTLKNLGIDFSGLIEDTDPAKTLNISYSELVLPLINAVKELSAENSILKSDVKDLKKDMVELKAMIEKSAIIKAQ